ncbi:DUF192 domain-containing protein [Candidatus Woesearchaeota archaeon]|nr:DUF192 domain-containing protein [Candidatus Woesearchaeota archaeon]
MKRILLLFGLLLLAGCARHVVTFENAQGSAEIEVEIADSDEELQRGLMFRDTLSSDAGMLFVFPDLKQRTFWMKNVRIPLDMIFVDSNNNVNEVKANLPPCKQEPCLVYPSEYPAQYVVEVNAGFAAAHNIGRGTKMAYSFG